MSPKEDGFSSPHKNPDKNQKISVVFLPAMNDNVGALVIFDMYPAHLRGVISEK
jgi:hypothetical protein